MARDRLMQTFGMLVAKYELTSFFDIASALEPYDIISDHEKLPPWWSAHNNFVLCPRDRIATMIPNISLHGGHDHCSNFILICNELSECNILVWGDGGLVYNSPQSRLVGTRIALGSGCIFVGQNFRNSPGITINCRNGGKVVLKEDVLIASEVKINTDDCHTIYSIKDGRRLNPFGGVVIVDRHVWIGQEATLMGNSVIGKNTIIGAYSFVRGAGFPDNVVLAGTPARVIAEDVNWDYRDIPPGTDMRSGPA